MMPLFDRLDLAPDAVFLLWVAGGMVAIGLVIGAYMVGKRAWRRGIGMRAQRRRNRRAYAVRIERIVERLKSAESGRG